MTARQPVKSRPNLSGINFDRQERTPYRPGLPGRLVAVVITVVGLMLVVYLLFNPVRIRPDATTYVGNFNRIAAAQGLPLHIDSALLDLAAGTAAFNFAESGLVLLLSYDAAGYLTGIELSDDPQRQPADGWLRLSPARLRSHFLLVLDALDAKWTMVALYRTFTAMDLDIEEPLAAQPAGSRETETSGLTIHLSHDASHFRFRAILDTLDE